MGQESSKRQAEVSTVSSRSQSGRSLTRTNSGRPQGVDTQTEDEVNVTKSPAKSEKKKKKKKKKDKEPAKKASKVKKRRPADVEPQKEPWNFEAHMHHIEMHTPESTAFTKAAFAFSVAAEWRLLTQDNTDLDEVDKDKVDRYVWQTTGNKPAAFPGFDGLDDEQKHISQTIANGSPSIPGVKFYDFVNFLLLGRDPNIKEKIITKHEWDLQNYFRFNEALDYVESLLPDDLPWKDEFMETLEDTYQRVDKRCNGHIDQQQVQRMLSELPEDSRKASVRAAVNRLLLFISGCRAEDRHRNEHKHAFVLFANVLLAASGHDLMLDLVSTASIYSEPTADDAKADPVPLKASGSAILNDSTKHRLKAVARVPLSEESLKEVADFDLRKSLQKVLEQLPEQVDKGPFVMNLRSQWLLLDRKGRGIATLDDVHNFVWAQSSTESAPAILPRPMQDEVHRMMRETNGTDRHYFTFWDLANVHLRSLHLHPDPKVTLRPTE